MNYKLKLSDKFPHISVRDEGLQGQKFASGGIWECA